MMYIESEWCCEINIASAIYCNLDMKHSKRPFNCKGSVLTVDDIDSLAPKYRPLCIEFDSLTQENQDLLTPQEEI